MKVNWTLLPCTEEKEVVSKPESVNETTKMRKMKEEEEEEEAIAIARRTLWRNAEWKQFGLPAKMKKSLRTQKIDIIVNSHGPTDRTPSYA